MGGPGTMEFACVVQVDLNRTRQRPRVNCAHLVLLAAMVFCVRYVLSDLAWTRFPIG
jgi:hypothetical protein